MNRCLKKNILGTMLTFGLMSCGSDNSAPIGPAPIIKTDNWGIDANVGHENKSFHKLEGLEELPITSSLQLSELEGELMESITIRSSCSLSPYPEIFSLEFSVPNTALIPVAQLLPWQAFQPRGSQDNLYCNIQLAVKNQRSSLFYVNIKKVRILGLAEYFNAQPLAGLNMAPQAHYLVSEVAELPLAELPLTEQNDKVLPQLLCDKLHRTLRGDWALQHFKKFWPDEIDKGWGVLNCRIILSDLTGHNRNQVSPVFFLHEEAEKIQPTSYQAFAAETDLVQTATQSVLEFAYENPNPWDIYLRFNDSQSGAIETVAVVFKQLGFIPPGGILPLWRGQVASAPLSWTIDFDGEIVEEQPSFVIIRLAANGKLRLSAQANLDMNCTAYWSKPHICTTGGHYILHGILTRYLGLPTLEQNRFATMGRQEFFTADELGQTGPLARAPFNGYSFWRYVKPPAGCIDMGPDFLGTPRGIDNRICAP